MTMACGEKPNVNANIEKSGLDYAFYILLKEREARKLDKPYGYSQPSWKCLLPGEILYRNCTTIAGHTNGTLRLCPFDKPQYFCECALGDVERLEMEEVKLLRLFNSKEERLKYLKKSYVDNGKRMVIDKNVYVKIRSPTGSIREVKGIIRYIGPLPGEQGTMFGVELQEGKGLGITDGLFKARRYFKCNPDCGVFVPLRNLRPWKDKKDAIGNDENFMTKVKNAFKDFTNLVAGVETENEEASENKHNPAELQLDDEVWVHIVEKPCRGILKYIGRIPRGTGTFAGIYLDDPVGQGNGEYNGIQLFNCPTNHAFFTTIENVISSKQFEEIYPHKDLSLTSCSSHKISSLHGPQTSEDILKMEWDFSKLPKDKVRDEQERLLKKIKKDNFVADRHSNAGNNLDEQWKEHDGRQTKSASVSHSLIEVNKDFKAHEISSLHGPQTSEDILKMESDFSKLPKDKVRDEQERLLKKIKKDNFVADSHSNAGNNLDEQWKEHDGRQTKSASVSHSLMEVNKDFEDSKQSALVNDQGASNASWPSELGVGSVVEVSCKNQKPRYGVIRWLGFVKQSNKQIAGLELEEEMDTCTDGTFLGKRYFTCPSRRGFFVHVDNCLPDSRFHRNSLTGTEFGPYKSQTIPEDEFIPPPTTLQVYLKNDARGIQGHNNSCYLDATLFAGFAFSFVLDSILLRPRSHDDIPEYERVQTVLRNNIIYPLRKYGFVRADRVMELRELLDRLGTITGLVGEEKDPDKFLTTLLNQVLKSEPFLKIKSGKVSHEYLYHVLADKYVERVLPSVEELLKKSFHQNDLKLTEVPSCLIVQMPRFGKQYKMYNRILPSLTINIGELVENTPQDCAVCGRLARFHCRECFEEMDSSGNFCRDCNTRVHSHARREKHEFKPIKMPSEVGASYANKPVERREMELFAVICIETSHFVTFAKCVEPDGQVKWCFFDSMADRIGGYNGYNIPSVTECPEIIEWLSSEKHNRERIINTDDKKMPDRVRRILGDAYVCLYESKEMAMYK